MDGHSQYAPSPGAGYYYSDDFATPSPTPSPRRSAYYNYPSGPPRPATRAHFRHARSDTDDYYYSDSRPAPFSPRYNRYEPPPSYEDSPRHSSAHTRRASHSIPQRPQTTRPASTNKAPPPITRKGTESDAKKHRIPAGYSVKSWDPTEEPILLLGSVFDANKMGDKRLYDYMRAGHSALSPSHASYRTPERRYLSLEFNGKPAYARPDSGVTGNAISEDYALSIGAIIEQPYAKHHFTNAKGHSFESVGTTSLIVSTPGSLSTRKEWTCSFAVVKRLAAPLVLGNQFLGQTKVLESPSFAHLIVYKTMSVVSNTIDRLKKVYRVMQMNLPTEKLACSLDDEPALAALDTGADIDLVALKYAKSRKWKVQALPDEAYVMLANEEVVQVAGYVETTLEIRGSRIPKRFYVLDGLVCDVVLGDPTIDSLDIYSKFRSSIIDTMEDEDMDRFHMIAWVQEIIQIEHDLEQLLAVGPNATTSGPEKNGWRSFFRKGAPRKDKSAESEDIVNMLRYMLEDVEVRESLWREAAEDDLLKLTGDELTRKKKDFDEITKKCDRIRDEIRQHIKVRLQRPAPISRPGPG